MPTFTTLALETLLDTRFRDSYGKSSDSKEVTSKSDDDGKEEVKRKKAPTPNHIYISPALYITPEPKPIPESSSGSLSPSPYVVNHKRRGGDAVNRRIDGFEHQQRRSTGEERNSNGDDDDGGKAWMNQGNYASSSAVDSSLQLEEMVIDDNFVGVELNGNGNERFVVEDDNFCDPQCDSFSVTSSNDVNDDLGKHAENRSAVSYQGDFFDAVEELSSDGSILNASPYRPSIESELHAIRLSLLEEIERREAAEDSVALMCSHWQKIHNLLSQSGLTFPTPSDVCSSMQLEISSLELFSQEIVVARFVADAIGKGQACAEAEVAAEAIIKSKDHEISRLRDRVQYYETVNHEMSQRNQEVLEVARRQRQRKRTQRRWFWGCLGLSAAIASAVIIYSNLPQSSDCHPSLTSSYLSGDCSSISSESA